MSDTDEDESPQAQRTQHVGGHGGGVGDEDEFSFDGHFQADAAKGPLKKTLDKPFDEVHEVSDSNDDSRASLSPSPTHAKKAAAAAAARQQQSFSHAEDEEEEESEHDMSTSHVSGTATSPPAPKKGSKHDKKSSQPTQGKPGNMPMQGKPGNMKPGDSPQKAGSSSEEEESESEEEEEDEDGASVEEGQQRGPGQAALYNPADYKHLVVSSEIQGLFEYILRHKHTEIELETKLKPFIPDYIPAVGEIDAFLKVPPPEGEAKKELALGLVVLDEPAAHQSDPTVLRLKLLAVNKQVISKHETVGTIEHADKNQARVLKWIQSIEEVHRKKPPPHVHYSHSMPDIESLMQVWPAEFEQLLASPEFQLPDMNSMDCDVGTFAKMVCALMDIPVHESNKPNSKANQLIESLHVLFTLYSEFQNNAYFQH